MLRSLKADIEQILNLRSGKESQLGMFDATVDQNFFLNNTFKVDSVNTKTFILLLASKTPLSFVSGMPVSLDQVLRDYNRNEFHHLYPKVSFETSTMVRM